MERAAAYFDVAKFGHVEIGQVLTDFAYYVTEIHHLYQWL
jgi:hypothetical protein